MSYELSFSDEFFYNEGEPYDGGPGPSDKPTSVWQALESLDDNLRKEICHEIGLDDCSSEDLMNQIRKVNSCSNLNSPVQVWIDEQGFYTIMVYNKLQPER